MTPKQIKTRRNKLRLSQFAVAKGAKVSRYKISLFENSFGPLTDDEQQSIDKFLTKKEEEKNAGAS